MSSIQFTPPVFLKNKHLQTIYGSKKKPTIGKMLQNEKPFKLDVITHEPVSLTGRYSAQTESDSKGVVILLHGWLGCVDSSYMLARGEALFRSGYDVVRLNMRDHGDSLGLNDGLFHACLLEEVYLAIQQIAANFPEKSIHLIGFSLGGSFALRIGWRNDQNDNRIPNLKQIIAICPSVEPEAVFSSIDSSMIYRTYFTYKLRKSLLKKQQLYAKLYDFSKIIKLKSCTAITEALIHNYMDFKDINDYFSEYRFDEQKLKTIQTPVHILVAEDDPVIPVQDIQKLEGINPNMTLLTTRHGGHVGYVNDLKGQSWLDVYLNQAMI